MSLLSPNVNYLTILVAAIISFILGLLWYSSLLFGQIWRKELGLKKNSNKDMSKAFIANFIGTLILIFVLSQFVISTGVSSYFESIQLAFLLWLGFFVSSTLLNQILWEDKSFEFFAINASYWLINLIVASLIIFNFS